MILKTSYDNWETEIIELSGPTPQRAHELALQSVRVDTIYKIDTVHYHTSDTVYLSETITLEGDVDTIAVDRTTTQRIFTSDTVYNFAENTITRVDSVYLLGSDYLDDLNRVTSITNELAVEKLGRFQFIYISVGKPRIAAEDEDISDDTEPLGRKLFGNDSIQLFLC